MTCTNELFSNFQWNKEVSRYVATLSCAECSTSAVLIIQNGLLQRFISSNVGKAVESSSRTCCSNSSLKIWPQLDNLSQWGIADRKWKMKIKIYLSKLTTGSYLSSWNNFYNHRMIMSSFDNFLWMNFRDHHCQLEYLKMMDGIIICNPGIAISRRFMLMH